MRIEYELKFRDYVLFNTTHQLLSIPVQLLYGGFAVFIFFASELGSGSWRVGAIVAIKVYLAMWAVQLVFNVFYLYFAKNRSLLTRRIVELQENAFYEESQFNKSYHFWPGIARVVNRPGFIAVYINGSAAHILPARAFSSPEHRRQFLSALKEKLSAV